MVTLIVGRTASGKSTLAKMLENMGAKILKSYTTREKRNESDTDHIFITKEEAKTFSHKVATTVINGNEYFATLEQFEDSDFYIIDPCGIETFLETMPDTKFEVIYVNAKKRGLWNEEQQKKIFWLEIMQKMSSSQTLRLEWEYLMDSL